MSPELYQRIVEYVADALDVVAFLNALPSDLRTPALASLFALAEQSEPASLWPTLCVSRNLDLYLVERSLMLFSCIDISIPSEVLGITLRPTTKVRLSGIATLSEYKMAVGRWKEQIVSLDVDFINDVWSSDELEEFCILLPTLPALKKMTLRWQMDIRDDLLPMPGKIMTAIASSSITDIEFNFEDWFNWDVEITKTFGSWLEERPVEKVAFDGLFIPHDNIHAPLFCQSLLGSTTLKSIAFKGGNITERFFKAKHKLPDNIQAIAMDLCSEEIIPDIVATIEHSMLHEISLKFRQTPPVFGLPGLLAKFNSTFRSMVDYYHSSAEATSNAELLIEKTLPKLKYLQRINLEGISTST